MASRKRCCIFGCNSSKSDQNITFHSFPADINLNIKWKESVRNNADLEDLNDFSLICSCHFNKGCFYYTPHKRLLKKEAIPTIFYHDPNPNDHPDPEISKSIVQTSEKSIQTYCRQSFENLQYTVKVLSLKLRRLQAKFNQTNQELQNEKEKSNKLEYNLLTKIKEDAENMNCKAIFIMNQIYNYKKAKPKWSEMTIRQCITRRFCSPKGYEYPRNSILKLPCKSTLNKYLGTGKSDELIKNRLLSEIKNLNSCEKLCSLIVDDMAVKERVSFSRFEDKIFGLDFKQNMVGDKDNPKIANQLLCFVIHGLSTKYIIPVSYCFHRQLNIKDLHKLTMDALRLLSDCGFIVTRLVGDNQRSNTALFKHFGNGMLVNSIPHPFYPGFKLFFSFDSSHLIKNSRNIFLDHDMASSEGIISSRYLKELYDLQKDLIIKPVRFLKKKHLFPTSYEKMKVHPAIQIFSPPVTASLRYLSEHGGPEMELFISCLATVRYMETMYTFFQIHDVSNRTQHIHCRDSNTAPYGDLNDERLLWLKESFPLYNINKACFSNNRRK